MSASAQQAPVENSLAARESAYAHSYERLVDDLISRHIPKTDYQVIATARVKKIVSGEGMPYVPLMMGPPETGVRLNPEELRQGVESVKLEIFLNPRHGPKAREQLKALILKKLYLRPAAGDGIVFNKLAIPLEVSKPDVERQLANAEAEVRDSRQMKDRLEKTLQESTRQAAEKQAELKEKLDKAQSRLDTDFWSQHGTAIIAGVALLITVLIWALFSMMTLRTASSRIQSGMLGVAKALENMNTVAATSLDLEDEKNAHSQGPAPDLQALSPAEGLNASLDQLYTRILTLHNELTDILKNGGARTESFLLRYLSKKLESVESAPLGVAVMELFGKDIANSLFSKLGVSHQARVMDFLAAGKYDRPKAEILLEVGEEIKTRLLAVAFDGVRDKTSDQVMVRVLKLRTDDLVNVLKAAPLASLPRLFLYLEAGMLADVLGALKTDNPARFLQVSQAIVKMPETTAALHLDADLLVVLDDCLNRAKDDKQRPFLSFYKDLVEASDDTTAEDLAEIMASQNQRVERFMRETIITFGTYFQLRPEIQEAIIDGLSNREVAALLACLDDDQKKFVDQHVDARRGGLIVDEVERLVAKGERQVKVTNKAVKKIVVARIIVAKGEGEMSDIVVKRPETLAGNDVSKEPQAA